jgi:predicted GNAT family acetyltransferase
MTIYKKLDKKNTAVLEMLIPIPQKSKIRLISRIQIPSEFKGKGYENDLLVIACELADKQDFTLYFQIISNKIKPITSWLKIHKFKVTSYSDLMYRLPINIQEHPLESEILEVKKYLEGDD